MDLGLKDRVYVVTGATRGLGNATARELVADGAKVVVTGREHESVAEAAADLGPDAVGVAVDNADPGAAARLIATARERFHRFDGILVSVGGPPPGFVADTTDEQWQAAFESVFLGAVRMARAAAAELGEGGVIGFVLSGSVHEPLPGLTISNGLRPGLAGFAKSLADGWARAASGSWGCSRGASTRTASVSSTPSPPIRRPPARRPSPASRCAVTAPLRSSAAPPPSSSPRPPPTSRASWSRWTAGCGTGSEGRSGGGAARNGPVSGAAGARSRAAVRCGSTRRSTPPAARRPDR
ncbi:hypothetical protein SHIRM173S_08922 [Streptomyces hirsutus]